ncbi:hypothetical protein ABKA04_000399 [Annulohypoxylon sp. FPYF3050]
MFLAANPDKARAEEEKEEMRQKYKPGDNVLPRVRVPYKSPEERRLEEIERQMLEEARQLSLHDAGVDAAESSRAGRYRDYNRSEDRRGRSDRDSSRETRRRDTHDRARRDDEHRRRVDSTGMLQPDLSSDERRRHRSESQHRSRESSQIRRRQVEHQSSIRSLISSSNVDFRDIEREIEEFARQIQEEGLLDGLDLDNIDLAQNDDLSRKITEAYRRRQRERARAHQPTHQPRMSDPQTHLGLVVGRDQVQQPVGHTLVKARWTTVVALLSHQLILKSVQIQKDDTGEGLPAAREVQPILYDLGRQTLIQRQGRKQT